MTHENPTDGDYSSPWDAIPVDAAADAPPLAQATDLPDVIALPKRQPRPGAVRVVKLTAEQSDVGFGIEEGLDAA